MVAVCGNGSFSAPSAPPVAPVRAVTDDYHGTKVVDPYRYMEDLKDPEVQVWFKGQNDYTRAVLASLPGRAQLLLRIRELDQSVPLVAARQLPGDRYVIWKQLPTEDVFKLYLRSGLNGQDRLLIDPEKITLTATNQSKGKNEFLSPLTTRYPMTAGIWWRASFRAALRPMPNCT
jgi:prolyl oligopeptidase